MSEITKEELLAMIEVQSKTATAMENIANSIRQVSEQNREQLKAQTELNKSLSEEREKCTSRMCATLKEGIENATEKSGISKTVIDSIKSDTNWLKIILGSATLIILIATVIVNNISVAKKVEKAFQEHIQSESVNK